MNIFIIIMLTGSVASLVISFGCGVYVSTFDSIKEKIAIVCSVAFSIITIIGIPMAMINYQTNEELAYISNYLSQKETIEESLENELITGYERAALVSKAAELNGELAERKMQFNRWYNIYADDTIYDDVTPIAFNGREA